MSHEGRVFSPYGGFQRRTVAPVTRPAGTDVVGGSSHGHRAAEDIKRALEVGRADVDVGVEVIDLTGVEAGQADMTRCLARGGRHDLHQAAGTHARTGVHDEAAFLADQAVGISRVDSDVTVAFEYGFADWHGKALRKIHTAARSFTGVDTAVPDGQIAGDLCRCQQLALTHAAGFGQVGGVISFAQADGDGVGRALETRVGRSNEDDDGFLDRHVSDNDADPLNLLGDQRLRQALVAAIKTLPEREQFVMSMYYEQDMNLKEIAAVLNITESRVCQLHSQSVARLRAKIRAH